MEIRTVTNPTRALVAPGAPVSVSNGETSAPGLRPSPRFTDAFVAPARPAANEAVTPLAARALGFEARHKPASEVQGSSDPKSTFHGGDTITSVIHLDGTGTISDAHLTLDLSHTDKNGVTVTLTDPSGKQYAVPVPSDHVMGATVDLSAALKGRKVAGDWTLTVHDAMKRDSGTLNAWSLDLNHDSSQQGKIQLYPMPDSGPQPILDALDGAKKSLDLSCYLITDQKVMDSLEAAAKRGVQVRVMMEPKLASPAGGKTYDQKVAELKAAGVQVEPTPPDFDTHGNVDHAKFMVIDNQQLLLGTGNLVKDGLGDGTKKTNRDLWLEDDRGESVNEAETLFTDDWNRTPTTGVDFKDLVITPDGASQRLLDLINGAKTRLYVYNQELEDKTITDALIAAHQRGVDVEVLAASPRSSTSKDHNAAAIQALTDAGIHAAEVSAHYMHAKAIVADGQAFIGSQNFSTPGLSRNREAGDIIGDSTTVDQLATMFKGDVTWVWHHKLHLPSPFDS